MQEPIVKVFVLYFVFSLQVVLTQQIGLHWPNSLGRSFFFVIPAMFGSRSTSTFRVVSLLVLRWSRWCFVQKPNPFTTRVVMEMTFLFANARTCTPQESFPLNIYCVQRAIAPLLESEPREQ